MQVTNGIPATQLPMARWRKSQASNPSGCCVEVAAFLTGVKNGEFDDLYPGGSIALSPEAAAAASGLRRPGQRGRRPRY